jgi:small subunit ribosomal protein S21
MHEVKVYDSSGNLKKVISVKKLNIRSIQQLESPSLFKKNKRTGKPGEKPVETQVKTKTSQLWKKECLILQVTVYQNQVERALKGLKRQLNKEGLFKELKRRRFYEKPSVKKKRKIKEAKKKRKVAMRRMRSAWHQM